ncbi:polysaccharide deacetylase family protein [Hymenobacter tibetensis]|uniref:Polysaccharide deacetylase family protein n=1 Tax=Hymenobacter tibetensis TaxID=497967 RepID=A0ABY4CSR8_9BACT|nr:polysaccharide deacetylase family protein [Hymenobacter tibetensis]UOG73294.1 polysaccharide deacetylase family protein [Hymenobacter tibetensis]
MLHYLARYAIVLLALWGSAATPSATAQVLRQPIPDKLVVLTFDDGAVSHATVVAPLLKKYGFGGTFFVCEFPPDFADKTKYMSWAQIQGLHQAGFEVASHTLTHRHVNKLTPPQLTAELDSIEKRCATYRIARPTTFAYPGYDTHPTALAVLQAQGYHPATAPPAPTSSTSKRWCSRPVEAMWWCLPYTVFRTTRTVG